MRSLFFPQITHPAGNRPRPDGSIPLPFSWALLLPETFISAKASLSGQVPTRYRTENETALDFFARRLNGAFAEGGRIRNKRQLHGNDILSLSKNRSIMFVLT